MIQFGRTESGNASTHRFYPDPVVWVEGDLDYSFVKCMLGSHPVKIKIANGVDECRKLALKVQTENLAVVVIMDGDYGILTRKRNSHRRVIYLQRYSTENYLFEDGPLCAFCGTHVTADSDMSAVMKELAQLREALDANLRDLVILDYAHMLADTGFKVWPDNSATILKSRDPVLFDEAMIENLSNAARDKVDEAHLLQASIAVQQFLTTHRFVDLLRGHILFGILRDLILNTLARQTGRRCKYPNVPLVVMLSKFTWLSPPTDDHRNLQRKVLHAVRDARCLRSQLSPEP